MIIYDIAFKATVVNVVLSVSVAIRTSVLNTNLRNTTIRINVKVLKISSELTKEDQIGDVSNAVRWVSVRANFALISLYAENSLL